MPDSNPRPHRLGRRRVWLLAIGGAVAIMVAAFAIVYLTLFRGSGVAPLALGGGTSVATGSPLASNAIPGKWTVSGGSVAGYRVREQLGFLPSPSDAVGRTSSVTGSVMIAAGAAGMTVTAAAFSVDVTTLTSDDSRRDRRVHILGLESDQYPNASFTLTAPITLPATAGDGKPFTASVVGRMTIHGTTQTVTIPVSAQVRGAEIELVGSLTFPFEQFGMTAPNVAGFVSVQDSATMEFDLHLQHG